VLVAAPPGRRRTPTDAESNQLRRAAYVSLVLPPAPTETHVKQRATWTPDPDPAFAANLPEVPGFLVVGGTPHAWGGLRGAPTIEDLAAQIQFLPGWDNRPIIMAVGPATNGAAELSRRLGVDVIASIAEVAIVAGRRLASGDVRLTKASTTATQSLWRSLARLLREVAQAGVWVTFHPNGAANALAGPILPADPQEPR
jgi:hypothetical protein